VFETVVESLGAVSGFHSLVPQEVGLPQEFPRVWQLLSSDRVVDLFLVKERIMVLGASIDPTDDFLCWAVWMFHSEALSADIVEHSLLDPGKSACCPQLTHRGVVPVVAHRALLSLHGSILARLLMSRTVESHVIPMREWFHVLDAVQQGMVW